MCKNNFKKNDEKPLGNADTRFTLGYWWQVFLRPKPSIGPSATKTLTLSPTITTLNQPSVKPASGPTEVPQLQNIPQCERRAVTTAGWSSAIRTTMISRTSITLAQLVLKTSSLFSNLSLARHLSCFCVGAKLCELVASLLWDEYDTAQFAQNIANALAENCTYCPWLSMGPT